MRIILLCLALLLGYGAFAQDEVQPGKLQFHFSVGQYPASLIVPSFSAIHPGVNTGVTMTWNKNQKHQLIQTGNLGFFDHRNLQKALQLFTEIGYKLKLDNGLAITPLALGGGYVMSISDINSLNWNAVTNQYEVDNFPVRHNWLISIGPSVGFETPWTIIKDKKTTFFLDYRLQIQGVFVQETVPVIAYAPLRVGFSFGL
ncbi:MAG: hypothetical protein DWQ02_19835 [Bacteroidetes bacterium]|nr:MAG: hypothetical protein DWQ02_19835 [Bacteroidota bacterium]